MSVTRTVNGSTYHVTTNGHQRELLSWAELEHAVIGEWFGEDYPIDEEGQFTPRFFHYRGAWYDAHDFECAGHDLKALGYDGVQTSSYFDAVALRYFDEDGYGFDGAVVVAHIHW